MCTLSNNNNNKYEVLSLGSLQDSADSSQGGMRFSQKAFEKSMPVKIMKSLPDSSSINLNPMCQSDLKRQHQKYQHTDPNDFEPHIMSAKFYNPAKIKMNLNMSMDQRSIKLQPSITILTPPNRVSRKKQKCVPTTINQVNEKLFSSFDMRNSRTDCFSERANNKHITKRTTNSNTLM